ncbi:nucleolar protein 56 [Trichonephila clavipes]|nr:nucleolar protein 56 [Trichonephila clavipes]
MSNLYVLHEHASGYSLFMADGTEEILPQVQESVSNYKKFKAVCNFVAFQPFKTGRDALENMNCVSEVKIYLLGLMKDLLGIKDTYFKDKLAAWPGIAQAITVNLWVLL